MTPIVKDIFFIGLLTLSAHHVPFDYLDARALVRLQADGVNRSLVPAFYRYLQAQDEGEYWPI